MTISRIKGNMGAQNNLIPESMHLGIHLFSEKHWFKYNAVIAKNISVDAAIMFGALANLSEFHLTYKKRKAFIVGDFWIQVRYDFIFSRIFLSDSRQKKATEDLKKAHFLEIKYREGKRKWVKIDWNYVNSMMSTWYAEMLNESSELVDYED